MRSPQSPVRLVSALGQQSLQCPFWGVAPTPFGQSVVVWTDAGILALWLATEEPQAALAFVQARHSPVTNADKPVLRVMRDDEGARIWCDRVFGLSGKHVSPGELEPIDVVVSGTEFERTVWQALCEIPIGTIVTYSDLARCIGRPKAARAVGSAIGRNGVAVVIPCHRVVPTAGGVGQFRWGSSVKRALLDWEAA